MKTIKFTALTLLIAFLAVLDAYSYPSGVSGYTRKTNASGCGSCHSTHSSANTTVQGLISGPASLRPGQTAQYTVRITGGGGTKVGVDISASAGTLANRDANLKLLNGELTQPSAKAYSGGSYTFNFNYTAPSAPGTVTLYATCMSTKTFWNFATDFIINVQVPFIQAPSNLTTELITANQPKVKLVWSDNSDNETSFRIERKQGAGTFSTLAVLPANSVQYFDTLLGNVSDNFTYRICAVNSDTISSYSNESSIFINLPVELVSFTSEVINNNILLKWITASETNNQGFEVQRLTKNGNWEKRGFVQGRGNNADKSIYSFLDVLPFELNEIIYRLKQINFDGTFELLPELKIAGLNNNITNISLNNYPNPFSSSTLITYTIPGSPTDLKATKVRLVIHTVSGKEVAVLAEENKQSGTYTASFNSEGLSQGIYICTLYAGEKSVSRKLVLIK